MFRKECNLRRFGLILTGVLLAFASSSRSAQAQTTVGFESSNIIYASSSSVSVKVVLSAASTDAVAVEYATQNMSGPMAAVAPGDYTATNGTLVFAPGATSQSFAISGINNAGAKGKFFSVILANPVNASLGISQATVNITNYPPPGGGGGTPTVEFSAKDYTVVEGTLPSGQTTKASIGVKLSAASATEVMVDYDFTGGTATAVTDYLVPTTRTVTIPAGQTTATFEVEIVADSSAEASETIKMTLSAPKGAMLGTLASATLTIIDDDSLDWSVTMDASQSAICAGGKNSAPHQAVITATLIDLSTGLALKQAGVAITFATTAGSVSPATAYTDANGLAVAQLTSDSYASEGAVKFFATVTASINAHAATTKVEFQPTQASLSLSPSSMSVGEVTNLVLNITKDSYGVEAHTVGWRMSRVWDADNNLDYDGTGPAPTAYGSFQKKSTVTDSIGYAMAEFRGTAPGTIELRGEDTSVILVASGKNPGAVTNLKLDMMVAASLANIYNSQNGKMVESGKEVTLGAFTVYNGNDTNGDGAIDCSQNKVKATQLGRDEVDLMRFVVHKRYSANGQKVKISLIRGAIRFWKSPTKDQDEIALDKTDPNVWWFEYDPKSRPGVFWLESYDASASLRDIEIKVEYDGFSENFRATSVWAKLTAAAYETKSAADLLKDDNWKDFTEQPREYLDIYGGTGLRPAHPVLGFGNFIVMKFKVYPEGIADEPGVKFDMARQDERKVWLKHVVRGYELVDQLTVRPLTQQVSEEPNDDGHDDDESIAPTKGGYMFSVDAPGFGGVDSLGPQYPETLARLNFREYVRVSFDGNRPLGDQVAGSRCSDYYDWHARYCLADNKGKWVRSTGDAKMTDQNDVGPGHITIGNAP